ncbi:efflux RND transporter permease subunit [Oligoflexus tunisiensis]|uniref:efflux RND transporter permease subunit n=1 Tax=Oligoflexus tunisiensis TaxID=708132 RepID=UPI000A542E79|nr:efflux RND transporter permease subunit [Oligoflexus tunisiensis]
MNISELSIRNHVFTWMLMFGLIFFGALAYREMGVSLNPDVDFPVANIRVSHPGAAPEVIEKDVIEPLESAVVAVPGIKSLTSDIRTGSGSISVEFELGEDIDIAIQELNSRISRARRLLPEDLEPPVLSKSNPEDSPILYLAVKAGKLSPRELMIMIKERIQDPLSSVAGVSEASVFGYLEPMIRVDLDLKKLKTYELTADDVIQAIEREHKELPSGALTLGEKDQALRVLGEVGNAEELKKVQITRRGGSPVYTSLTLGQVAHIYEGTDEISRISRVNGETTATIGIRKQRGSNAVEVADSVKARIAELNKILPEGTAIEVNFDSTTFIRESVEELVVTIVLAAALTSLVCWLFLGSWIATFNIILAIPTSIIGSFIVLSLLDFTLNTFTLLGLSLAIGIVVDDAIIVLENIFRHRRTDKDPVRSALTGSREITLAILATTAAVVAIFLPIAFIKGIVGRFIFQFGVTISVAVLLSMVESLTLAPMRISRFKGDGSRTTRFGRGFEAGMDWLGRAYGRSLGHALRFRWLYLGLSLLAFAGSLYTIKLLKTEFAPALDEGRAYVSVKTPEGSSLEYTDARMKEVEAAIQKLPFVQRYFSSIGGWGGGGRNNSATMIVIFGKPKERGPEWDLTEIEKSLREAVKSVPGVQGFVRASFSAGIGGGRGQPVEFIVKGPNDKELRAATKNLIEQLEKTGLYVGINADNLNAIPETHVIPDREAALRYGVDVATIAGALNTMFSGTRAGNYSQGGRRYPIMVRLPKETRNSIDVVKSIEVRNNRGQMVPLHSVVKIVTEEGPLTIFRDNRQRGIEVSAGLVPEASQGVALERVRTEAAKILPPGYFVDLTGSSESFQESFESFMIALALGILVSYMVLASQFNSFIDPITILMALPFSVSGALLALWGTGQSLNMYSMIGLILLMGIAKKNSILLVEFTHQLRDQGYGLFHAIQDAGRLRLRPILMTTLATVVGAIPAALSLGPGSETRIPMAMAVIGGVFFSTPLTLYVVPIVYSLFTREEAKAEAPLFAHEASAEL